jgi:hypothetical protein
MRMPMFSSGVIDELHTINQGKAIRWCCSIILCFPDHGLKNTSIHLHPLLNQWSLLWPCFHNEILKER